MCHYDEMHGLLLMSKTIKIIYDRAELGALVSTIDSITSLPLPFNTAITIASLCTSMPIYWMSRLIKLPPWGKEHHAQRRYSVILYLICPPSIRAALS